MALSFLCWSVRCCEVNECCVWGVMGRDVYILDVWIVGYHVQGYDEMCWLVHIGVVCYSVCLVIEVEQDASIWLVICVVTNGVHIVKNTGFIYVVGG